MTETAVYEFYDGTGALLYVGCSAKPGNRKYSHRKMSAWYSRASKVLVDWFPSRDVALWVERDRIIRLKPIHNIIRAAPVGDCPMCDLVDELPVIDPYRCNACGGTWINL